MSNKTALGKNQLVWATMNLILISGMALRCGVGLAQDPRADQSQQRQTPAPSEHQDVLIASGDLLGVVVFDTPELSGPARVSNSGILNLPLIGNISVSGLTPVQASDLIRSRLISMHLMVDPQVSIFVNDLANHGVTVLGEVLKPGPVPITGVRRLWEMIGASGGVTAYAGSRLTIIHSGKSAPDVLDIHWDRDLASQADPVVEPGDVIQVSRAGMIYVVGQVGKQGAYPILHDTVTLSQVLSAAEGLKYSAKGGHTRLIRHGTQGRTIIEIDAAAIMKGKLPDIALRDGDLVYVPLSVSKVAIARGIEAAITISSSLAVYSQTR